jgi:hypothetical protein
MPVILLLTANAANGQAAPASQFDFLAGQWTLHDPSGARVGQSRVVVQAPRALLYEERVVGNNSPQPLWLVNSERTGGWAQLFVGVLGLVREFPMISTPGEWPVVMGADVVQRDGSPVRFRLTMTRASDNESRRILERSGDRGTSWAPVFDYTYRRAPTP